jgi:single-strand DNA-binding protein
MNMVLLIGNIGRDPDLKYTKSGQSVCNFSIGVNESYKGKDGEWKQSTEWVSIVAWGKAADRAGKFAKGQRVFVRGKYRTRTWTDRNENKHYMTEVLVMFPQGQVEPLVSLKEQAAGDFDPLAQGPAPENFNQIGPDDDIPF